jgi:hypothetical protein
MALGLERPVAARAVPASKDIGLRLEYMARVAIHRHAIEIDVRQRSLFFVALRADSRIGSVEGGFARVVAFVALHFAANRMCGMALRKPDLRPTLRYCPWRGLAPRCLDLLKVTSELDGDETGDEAKCREHHDSEQGAFHRPPK